MSLSSEIREQLLSGYLDDALSADERAQVEHLLRSDRSFVEELDELKELRSSLKDVFQEDQEIRLASGFASRVLDAAVAQAASEGLPEDHPLVRLAEQPATIRSRPSTSTRRMVAVLLAVAASLGLAIFLVVGGDEDQPVAQREDATPNTLTDLSDGDDLDAAAQEPLLAQNNARTDEVGATAVADNVDTSEGVTPAVSPSPLSPSSGGNSPATESIASAETGSDSGELSDRGAIPLVSPSAGQRGIDDLAGLSSEADPDTLTKLEEHLLQGGMPTMVYSVRLTEQGRESNALINAMQRSGIDSEIKKPVAKQALELVDQDQQIDQPDEESVMLYLQAPAKSLDRLHVNLLLDEQGVESVGLALCTNESVAQLTNSLRINPKDVQHEGRLLELSQAANQVQGAKEVVKELPFTFGRKPQAAAPVPGNGVDPMLEVLVIVR